MDENALEAKLIPKGAVYQIEVENEKGEKKKCYLKKIDRVTLEIVLGLVMDMSKPPQYIRAGEVLINSLWIDGDPEIKTDEDLLTSAAMKAFGIVKMGEGSLKKL